MSSGSRSPVRQTIAFRLALWYAAVFAAALALIGGLTYALLARSLRERDRELVHGTLLACAGRWEDSGLAGVRAVVAERGRTGEKGEVFVRVLDGTRDVLFLSAPPGWADLPLARADIPPPGSGVTWGRLTGSRGDAIFEVASVALPDGTILEAGRSTEQREELLRRYRGVLLPAGVAVLLAAVAGGLVLTHAALRPLRQLNETVRGTVETGRLDARVPTRGTDDPLDELGEAFNALLVKISGLVNAMRSSLDDVAHDLRTPLARLRAVAERALRSPDDPAALREGLGAALEEAQRVSSLLDEMMDVAEAESGAMRLGVEGVSARTLLRQAVELFADAAEEKGVDLDVEAEADFVLAVDAVRMRQVLANLLDNALKYTRPGGKVRLRAGAHADAALLEVEDDGIGIPPEDLPRVFDRLYRGDRSRSERGLGLGLALVRAIVEAHGGSVSAESDPGRCTRFTVRLPGTIRS